MDVKARIDVKFNRSLRPNSATDFFFHFDITEYQNPSNSPYKISAKYTCTKPCGEKHEFNAFAIFNIDGHLGFSTRLCLTILKSSV